MAADYFCIECGLPGEVLSGDDHWDWSCWACRGPVVSDFQLAYWNNLPFRALLDERCRQIKEGKTVQLAGYPPGVHFSLGAAVDMLLLDANLKP